MKILCKNRQRCRRVHSTVHSHDASLHRGPGEGKKRENKKWCKTSAGQIADDRVVDVELSSNNPPLQVLVRQVIREEKPASCFWVLEIRPSDEKPAKGVENAGGIYQGCLFCFAWQHRQMMDPTEQSRTGIQCITLFTSIFVQNR